MNEDSDWNDVPRGIDLLIQQAAVDQDFKNLLLERRAEAAEAIGITLNPAEKAMLGSVPAQQLETLITQIKAKKGEIVQHKLMRVRAPRGIQPDRP
jgi:hypothetical protein